MGVTKAAPAGQSRITLEEAWAKLRQGLQTVFTHQSMTTKQYMEYYNLVFVFCTQQQASKINEPSISAENQAKCLYDRAKEHNRSVAASILEGGMTKTGEDLLNWYCKVWVDYRFCSAVVNGIFSYLNRNWIGRMNGEGSKEICSFQTLLMALWKEALFSILGSKVTDAVLEQIRRERCGEQINRPLLKAVLTSYVEMGVTDEGPEKKEVESLRVYTEKFQTPFILATQEFFEAEAKEFLANNTVTEYMKKVEKRLLDEEERGSFYLHSSTAVTLKKSVEEVLITGRIELFQGQFGPLLELMAKDDLKRMYDLCSRVDTGLQDLRIALQKHIVREGVAAIDIYEPTADKDPKSYVLALLEIHERYSDLIKEAFKNEQGFNQSLDKAASLFVNQNAVTMKNNRHNPSKTPELLARTCDGLLKKSSKMLDENELEAMLEKMMVIFKYVEDKDIFAKIYVKLFSKRLIGETSATQEGEVSMIGKLKTMSGYEYTQRMTKMVSDMQTSIDLNDGYKEKHGETFAKEKLPDFSTLVISTGSWPSIPPLSAVVPDVITRHIQLFTYYYTDKYTGRKLTWALSQGRGEVTANCFSSKKIFVATAPQITILMLFNKMTSYSFEEIVAATSMDRKTTALTLAALVKGELIKGEDLSTTTEYNEKGIFELNLGYKNKKVKIDLMRCVVRSAEAKKEEDKEMTKSVEEDRSFEIQACIVRIAKMRKKVGLQQLIAEVMDQVKNRFSPRVRTIKACIEILIEREYVERSKESNNCYEYVA